MRRKHTTSRTIRFVSCLEFCPLRSLLIRSVERKRALLQEEYDEMLARGESPRRVSVDNTSAVRASAPTEEQGIYSFCSRSHVLNTPTSAPTPPPPVPAPKKPAAKGPASKKPVSKEPASRMPATKDPVPEKAAPKKAAPKNRKGTTIHSQMSGTNTLTTAAAPQASSEAMPPPSRSTRSKTKSSKAKPSKTNIPGDDDDLELLTDLDELATPTANSTSAREKLPVGSTSRVRY